ncbi:MAG: NitT/TauT family transport system permease protein [Frankiaceae bacterium]|nr:NitT/TauT family transport system permease protein [Frankiaceae bacterium]
MVDTLVRPTPTGVAVASDATGPQRRWLLVNIVGRILRSSVAISAFLVLWQVAPQLGFVDRVFLPPFSTVARAWWTLATNGQLEAHSQASLVRALTGFAFAIAVAVPLGLLIGWYRGLAATLNPLLEVFRNTAALALLPVFILILGIGETSKITVVFYSCLWPILLNTVAAVRGVDPLLVKSARSMGLGPAKLFAKVVLPASVPTIFTGIRIAGAYSVLVLLAAEMFGAKAGLGYLILSAQSNFQIPQMYAGIITISLLGLALNVGLLRLERRLSRWRTVA